MFLGLRVSWSEPWNLVDHPPSYRSPIQKTLKKKEKSLFTSLSRRTAARCQWWESMSAHGVCASPFHMDARTPICFSLCAILLQGLRYHYEEATRTWLLPSKSDSLFLAMRKVSLSVSSELLWRCILRRNRRLELFRANLKPNYPVTIKEIWRIHRNVKLCTIGYKILPEWKFEHWKTRLSTICWTKWIFTFLKVCN